MTSSITPVLLKLEQLTNDTSSGVMGNIWLVADDYIFPEAHWSDFAEIITGWWIIALIDLYRSNGKWHEKILLFMDGPCEITLRNGPITSIHFVHDGIERRSFSISLPTFTKELIYHRRHLLNYAVAAGWKKSTFSDLERCDWLETLVQQAQNKESRPVN
jgi:hypothetical protein